MEARLHVLSFETVSRDTKTLNLPRNVSKFCGTSCEFDERAAEPKCAAREVYPLYYSQQ